jgi:choline dehydrogenase-like flavoprotein
MAANGYDYIVVGGGSSGCVTATRLVRDHGARVLLLEAGPARGSRLLGMPAGYMKYLAKDTYLTMHRTVPKPQLGGGSAVNAMVYMRGDAADYDGWDRLLGGAGWSYRDLLPYFRRQEDNDHLNDEFHGCGGPLKVSHLGHHCAMSRAYVRALQEGATRSAHAGGEVILTTGTYVSPKLLMLSGIGPAAELKAHGIAVRADLPGVGQNLQDHHEVPVVATTNGAYGYFGQDRGLAMMRNGLQYLLFKSGPVSTTGVEACAFINPDGTEGEATLQMYCVPTVYLDRDVMGTASTHGVTLNSCLLRPKARGSVRLASADPREPPRIDPQFFGHPDDLRITIAGLRFAREVLATQPVASMVSGEIMPGATVRSDAALTEHCKRTVKTTYHPVGTCRMGRDDDPMGVLTPDLRVRGVEGLRVFDCSMMPTVISGNTNAPALAIADKAVALMMGEASAATLDPPVRAAAGAA